MTKIEREIRSEIAKAVQHLGGSAELVATIEGKTKEEMYDAAEQLNADHYLLASIGLWGDTLEDDQVLANLRKWNAGAAAVNRMADDLTDDERKLLVNVLTVEIEAGEFPLSPRIVALKGIKAKLKGESC
jgi:hypothetical protein